MTPTPKWIVALMIDLHRFGLRGEPEFGCASDDLVVHDATGSFLARISRSESSTVVAIAGGYDGQAVSAGALVPASTIRAAQATVLLMVANLLESEATQ